MRLVRLSLALLATAVFFVGYAGTPAAFHSGGVAECGGCHSMHSPRAGGSFLLIGSDQSSTCLNCHEHAGDTGPSSYHISTADADLSPGVPPRQRTPGGDFAWLKKTYNWIPRSGADPEEDLGENHGHNIVADDFGYIADASPTAPGGSFPSGQLACSSCHDPHGQFRRNQGGTVARTGQPIWASGSYYSSASGVAANEPTANESVGVYRLLAGAGYTQDGVTFLGVPAAKAPSSYNRTEATTQTRVAYGLKATDGHVAWGVWCATCHPNMHSNTGYKHPVDLPISSATAQKYQQYVKTGDMTGSNGSSFTSLVPFAKASGDYAGVLAPLAVTNDTQLGGPAGLSDQVTCMSCHRAHASGWKHALRWNMEGEFMTYNSLYPGTDSTPTRPQFSQGRTEAETRAAYYDRDVATFATYQRVLCNKCHAKD